MSDFDDSYDGLGLCEVCGDCYTSPGQTVCSSCQRQQAIDNDWREFYPCKICGNSAPWNGALCRDCYRKREERIKRLKE